MSGAEANQTTRLKSSAGVILLKSGFGMTAVGMPRMINAPPCRGRR